MFKFKITENYGIEETPRKLRGISAETVPIILLTSLVFVLPLFFLPGSVATLLATKMFLIHLVVLVSLFVVVLLKLREQSFLLPLNLMTLSMVLIPVITIIATLFSKNVGVSFTGRDFGVDTLISVITLFVLLSLVILQFKNRNNVTYVYVFTIFSFLAVFILQTLVILVPGFPTLGGVFANNISTTLGKWNDLAIFATLIAIITLITPQLLRLEKTAKVWNYAALIASMITLIVVGFNFAWYALALFTLVLFVYVVVIGQKHEGKSVIPIIPLVIFLTSFLFIIAGDNLGGLISNTLKINHFEVRPSWTATIDVIKGTISERPILGSGPATFESEWLLYKPTSINLSDFWNVDFRYGVGIIPSLIVTTGILGALSWIFFFGLIIFYGFKGIFSRTENIINHYILVSSFIATVYLWSTMVFYLPSVPLVALTFIFTGIFIASLYEAKILRFRKISIEEEPKYGFIYITVLILVLIGTITMTYGVTNKFVAHTYFRSTSISLNVDSNLQKAEVSIRNAIRLDQNDVYYRSLAEIGSIRITSILNDSQTPQDLLIDQFRTTLSSTVSSYQSAIDYDSTNYNNYRDLGELYQALVPLKVAGAYEQSKLLLEQAITLNPKDPGLVLQLARLEVAKGDFEKSKEYIAESLKLKPNYTDAIFLLSQVQVSEGNTDQAIKTVENATLIKPNDPLLYFQLGILLYTNNQFARAIPSLERALLINPLFQNAKYFLGLSYYQVDRNEEAVIQFENLLTLNPGNEEIQLILGNLKSGLQPFSGARPPIDSSPEEREDLPLEDESGDSVEE